MATIKDLQTAMSRLNEKDQDFAKSLMRNAERMGGCSSKMAYWVDQLVGRAAKGAQERATAAVGDMKGVLALFAAAQRSKLKRPAIVISLANTAIRLTIATDRAQVPGSVNVVNALTGEWYGRVLVAGTFEASRKYETPAGLVDALVAFAANPAEVAAANGRLTGRCCFCDLPLKDERSTAVGYGRTCAKNWGVAWGKAKHAFTCQPATEEAVAA
jgi:hypothetical protein